MNKKIALVLGVVMLAGCATDRNARSDLAEFCKPIDEAQVASLFERWNNSLQTGDPEAVVKNYADRSVLLPTLSGKNRITKEEKEDYFTYFLADRPTGTVTARQIDIGCNVVVDSGLYTFHMAGSGNEAHARYTYTYKWENNQWLITSHHSSLVPEE